MAVGGLCVPVVVEGGVLWIIWLTFDAFGSTELGEVVNKPRKLDQSCRLLSSMASIEYAGAGQPTR